MGPRTLLIIVSGPSGAGKDSIVEALIQRGLPLRMAITATTRSPRPGEQDGVDYHFVSPEEFGRMIADDQLLEWAEVYGNRYGVPRAQVREALERGESVIVRTDVQGVANIRRIEPTALTIFVAPPSMESLEKRLTARGGIDGAGVRRRLEEARSEMHLADGFDFTVVNEDGGVAAAVDRTAEIIESESRRTDRPWPVV